jgi:hypothetical protein
MIIGSISIAVIYPFGRSSSDVSYSSQLAKAVVPGDTGRAQHLYKAGMDAQ